MVQLFCVVAGVGSVFPVDINMRETVHGLKRKLKEEKPNAIYFDADLLKLYLAKEGDRWLNTQDEDIKALKEKPFPNRIKDLMHEQLRLDEACRLNNDECFGDNFTAEEGAIHVLVEFPDEPDQAKINRKYQDGSTESFVEELFSLWHSSWSSVRLIFTVEKEKRD